MSKLDVVFYAHQWSDRNIVSTTPEEVFFILGDADEQSVWSAAVAEADLLTDEELGALCVAAVRQYDELEMGQVAYRLAMTVARRESPLGRVLESFGDYFFGD